MQRITGLPDEQVLIYEAQAEAALRAALADVMDRIAKRVEASAPVLASALVLVAADAGDEVSPSSVPQGDGLPPGQPYVSPDDLTSIPPLWQQAVADQILPIVGQVFLDAAMRTHANMIDASSIAGLPSAGSLAAEQYLARARNSFEQIGDTLWAQARSELTAGFEAGESIPQLAERLRQSANVTARTGVLVARTQVNEASNAGSFETARASGLQMQKEWIATPDLRTRPTHLAADGQRVDLNEPFIVGGFSAMFPAAPTLPPAERYSCRCTIGYVMPDRAPAQVKADDLAEQQLADLPGTTPSERLQGIIDEQHAQVEAVIEDVHQRFGERFGRETGPGFDEPARGGFVAPSYVRPSLRGLSRDELRTAWQDQVSAITGHPFHVAPLPADISLVTAREYAEGTLQMFTLFPEARLDRIVWFDDAASSSYAQVRRGGHAIEFNMRYARDRVKFLQSRQKDVAGWVQGRDTSWGVRNDTSGQGIVYHEFMHILDLENTRDVLKSKLVPVLLHHAGVDSIEDTIKRQISSYAASGNYNELIAEAGVDVMVNGERASQLSKDIIEGLRIQYRQRGFEIRTAPALPEDLGDVFPKAAARQSAAAKREALAATKGEGEEVRPILGGSVADLRLYRASDGDEFLIKRYPASMKAAAVKHEVDAEILGSRLVDAVGGRAAVVAPNGRDSVLMEFIEGKNGRDFIYDSPNPGAVMEALTSSDRGRLMGVADYLGMNSDRFEVNVMIGAGDEVISIDQGGMFALTMSDTAIPRGYFSEFMRRSDGNGLADRIDLHPDDLAVIRQRVADLEPEFKRQGRTEWFDRVMHRVDELATRTDPAARIRLANPVGEVFARAAAPRALSTQTVAQLRALAKERGIAIPAGARKADLVKALEDAPVEAVAPVGDALVRFDRLIKSAKTGDSALAQAPLGLRGFGQQLSTGVPVDAEDALRQVRMRDGFKAYIGHAFEDINVTLRGGLAALRKRIADHVSEIRAAVTVDEVTSAIHGVDEAMDLSRLIDDVTVYRASRTGRGIFGDPTTWGDDLSGFTWTDPAYASTSTVVRQADYFLGDGGVRMRMVVPKGSSAVQISDSEFESELLLGRGAEFRVVRDNGWKTVVHPGTKKKIRYRDLDVEVKVPDRPPAIIGEASKPITPTAPLDEKALLRAAARERNRLIESSQGTAKLLAEVDELIANKASKAAIRQRLDPALIAPEQVFAGADPTVVEALRTALDTGDPAKLRAALTRAGTKSKLKPISKAGAKTKYDPETMEGVGGIDIPAGAQVTVVRRGTTLTLPDGSTMQLTRAQVTPIAAPKPPVPVSFAPAEVQARQAALREAAARPTLPDKSRRQSGENAYTTQVEHVGGPPTITKDFSRLGESPAASKRRADAEELGALVSEASGIRAPAVIRTGPRSVEMEFIDAPSWDDFEYQSDMARIPARQTNALREAALVSDDGRLLGLADILMGNTDRNTGNWLRLPDGRLVAIDHETAFGAAKLGGADEPFGAALLGRVEGEAAKWPDSIDINPADLAVIRARLEALRPEFERLGRAAWHRQVMARLAEVEKRADFAAPIRLPGVKPLKAPPRPATAAVSDRTAAAGRILARFDELRVSGGTRKEFFDLLRPEVTPDAALITPELMQSLNLAVGLDPAKLTIKLRELSTKAKVKPISRAGVKTKFDPETMEMIDGSTPAVGTRVEVVRRGTKGVEKAQVRLVGTGPTPEQIAEALRPTGPLTRETFGPAIKQAQSGREALQAAPIDLRSAEAIDALPVRVRTVVEHYRGDGYRDINDYLRGRHAGTGVEQDFVDQIDQLFDQSALTHDVELWRAPGTGRSIFGPQQSWGSDLTGFTWRDDAYSSATASERIADRFTVSGGVRMRMYVPRGTPAVKLSNWSMGGGEEAEMLLARGAQFRVVRDRGWTTIKHPTSHQEIRIRDLDVEVTMPTK